MSLTVVIPAHGSADRLRALLAALDDQSPGALEVVVVDDASPEPLVIGDCPRLALRVVRTERNRGPGGARNRGLEEVHTAWVGFLDADMLPGERWVERALWRAAEEGPAGVEGRVEVAGGEWTPFTHATEFVTTGGHHGAGNVLFAVEALREIGGFDERFYDERRRLHFREDTDVHFRLAAAGHRVEHDPELVALHPPLPPSFWRPLRASRRYYFDPLLARKHPREFRRLIGERRLGPFPLRWARHQAALAVAAGVVAALAGAVLWRPLLVAGLLVAAAGWLATAVALSWRRNVLLRHLPALAAAAALAPWVYLYHYYRGVLAFGHLPRLT